MSASIEQRNQDATTYVGNLDEKVTEELLWELMLQAGAVVNVHIPRDKVTSSHQGYGFVEFRTEDDAEYAMKIMNMIQLYGKVIRVKKASQDRKTLDVGANLFIGNLDPDVDEKLLYDTFSAFGGIVETPKIMRDPDTKISRGFGFIGFDCFEASDLAIECMNGQYLANRPIVVQYAFKKDSNERHGSQAERLLASSNPNKLKPNTRFAFTMPAPPFVAAVQPPPPPPVAPPQAPLQYTNSLPPPPPPQFSGGYGVQVPMQMIPPAIPQPPPLPSHLMATVPMPPPHPTIHYHQ